jgi:ribose-phosphate pyrophosphokinase
MRVFALSSTKALGEAIAGYLGTALSPHEERDFEDGEHKARPLESVRGEDCYVIQSLHGEQGASANDKLCKLLFFIATLRTNGARRLTAIVPYLAYARKDRQTKPRDPVTTQYVAQLFEAVGTDILVNLEAHNFAAFQNAFRCQTIHLDTARLFSEEIQRLGYDQPIVVASPDPGGVKRAQLLREKLETLVGPVGQAFFDKRRSGGIVTGETMVGEVTGASVIIMDDLIATGGTIARAAKLAIDQGARRVIAMAAHGLFAAQSFDILNIPSIERIIVTDSVAPFSLPAGFLQNRVEVLSVGPLLGECIRRLAGGGSIADLLD